MNEKISVIICCYNQGKFLTKTINSVLNQTYKNIEIVLVNDGSTDNTNKIALEYQNKLDNFIYIDQENTGLGIARNRGIKKATGPWIFILDSDDILQPLFLEKATSLIEDENSVIYPRVTMFSDLDNSDKKEDIWVKKDTWIVPNSTFEDELNKFCTFVSLLATKNNFLKSGMYVEPREYMQMTDWDMSLKLRSLGCKFICLEDYTLFHYRVHKNSMSNNTFFGFEDFWINVMKYKLHTEKYEKAINDIYLEILNRNADRKGMMHYFEKIKMYKFNLNDLRKELLNSKEYKNKFKN